MTDDRYSKNNQNHTICKYGPHLKQLMKEAFTKL